MTIALQEWNPAKICSKATVVELCVPVISGAVLAELAEHHDSIYKTLQAHSIAILTELLLLLGNDGAILLVRVHNVEVAVKAIMEYLAGGLDKATK